MPARGGSGGAVFADSSSTTDVEYSTFSGNLRGPASFAEGANGVAGGRVAAPILADPAPACQNVTAGPLRSVTLPGDASCPGPRLEGDPRLGPLAANGGPTATLLPGPGSAAIDALAGAPCPATDQRGLPRPRLGGCDAGSVEVQPEAAGAGPGASGTSSPAARRVSGLRLRPAAFRAAGAGGSVGKLITSLAQRAPIGTTVAYRLDGAARLTFTIRKPLAGRRAGRRCVRPAAAPPGARRCTRQQRLKGSFAHRGAPGQNSFRFTGRLRRKALAPGSYTLVAKLPRPARGRGATATPSSDRAVRMRRTTAFVAGAALAGLVAVPLAAAKPRTVSFVSVVKTYPAIAQTRYTSVGDLYQGGKKVGQAHYACALSGNTGNPKAHARLPKGTIVFKYVYDFSTRPAPSRSRGHQGLCRSARDRVLTPG